ncbi:hypothetical protein ERJ75_000610900 [Trypanosoma vivax]|nr:hypothetical protein ERJ75_000610900 [Trypanosoma vivax]
MNKKTAGGRDLPKGHRTEARSTRGPGKNQRGATAVEEEKQARGLDEETTVFGGRGQPNAKAADVRTHGDSDGTAQRRARSEKKKGQDRHKARRSGRPFPRRRDARLAGVECGARGGVE